MKHKGTTTLESERLLLRPFRIDDAEAMYRNWASDPEVTQFLTWPAYKKVETAVATLQEWTNSYADNTFYQWAIILKGESNDPIGSISVVNSIDEIIQDAEIGYCIGKRWWHRGITTEALQLIIAFLFDEVGVKRVSAKHDINNPHSGDVMHKCGMKYEGTLRRAGVNNQGICDMCVYGILDTEWMSV